MSNSTDTFESILKTWPKAEAHAARRAYQHARSNGKDVTSAINIALSSRTPTPQGQPVQLAKAHIPALGTVSFREPLTLNPIGSGVWEAKVGDCSLVLDDAKAFESDLGEQLAFILNEGPDGTLRDQVRNLIST